METLRYKGYTGSIEYSSEDRCLFGKVLGLNGTLISYEGKSIEDLSEDFEGAVDEYLASCADRNIESTQAYP